ncbi:M20 peptidase aminoacylase family protein [Halobacillus sp. A1]|uniref:M20 peptidase aminoacylase family protein n=1 Tax=Halobacillus sp. A1 TaxID=2880262 RepID=UPI0020A69017|nr:M20 peptidase aminoacylase family protein [Halobacillus sp. A1]MCP3032547.1 M20 peptidase aminoacylase family protein [Halobacillus sp. A1]
MKETIEQRVIETFHYLHKHAEISWEEEETTKFIEKLLIKSGCKVTTFTDCTGVIGELGNFNAGLPVVGVRADIDALWQLVDGTFQANHSCGHDAHMAMVLGLLWKLEKEPDILDNVAVKFIFQPAEEKMSGALKMVEKQVVDDVDYLFGIHLRPGQEIPLGVASPVIVHGAAKMIHVEINGMDAHGARPHLNDNAIEVGAQIVHLLSSIHLDPQVPHSVKMTSFHAGGKSANIIPGHATFSLDLRAQNNELMDELEAKVHSVLDSMEKHYDIEVEITHVDEAAAARTNKEAIEIMSEAISQTLGEEHVHEPLITPGGDDFHFYTIEKPALKATMLGLGCDLKPGLHHPEMTFKTSALMNGVDILFHAVKKTYEID